MIINAKDVVDYISQLPIDKKEAIIRLRKTVLDNIPKGFEECLNYNTISYVIPHSLYPAGYHCQPKLPVPFVSIAAQKNFVAFYHMGIYAMPELLKWFTQEFPKHSDAKLDMGKSCIRFKNPNKIPFELMGELMQKVSAKEWIDFYQKAIDNRKKK
jgi:Domain of unknown function (DU1801)